MSISNRSSRELKRAGLLTLAVTLLLASAACTTSPPPDESGEVLIGYDDAGQPETLLLKPVDGGVLTSRFGVRKDPITGGARRHLGTDYGAPIGSPVHAAGEGVVASVGLRGSYGNYVLIRHDHTYATGYAHLNGFYAGLWSGERVHKGQVIGYVGTTGRSTGPHLHYEVYDEGERIDPFDLKPSPGTMVASKSFSIPDTGSGAMASKSDGADGTVASQADGADGTVARKSFSILDTASETISAAGETLTAATQTLFATAEEFSHSETGEKLSDWGRQAKVAFEQEVLTPLDLEKLFDGFGDEDPDVIHE